MRYRMSTDYTITSWLVKSRFYLPLEKTAALHLIKLETCFRPGLARFLNVVDVFLLSSPSNENMTLQAGWLIAVIISP